MTFVLMMVGFLVGSVATFSVLVFIGRSSGKTGPNSRVRHREKVVAVIERGAKPH